MALRNEFFGIAIVATVCLLLIGLSQKQTDNKSQIYQRPLLDINDGFTIPNNYTIPTPSIQDVIQQQRDIIAHELADYEFTEGSNLEDYTPSVGGRPLRTVIITTWRSGSTFLGDVLNSIPGNFYHYEPLLDYEIVRIRGPPLAKSALFTLRSLLNCDYTHLHRYLWYGMSHLYLFTHNTRLWNQCEQYPQYCWNATFLNDFCKLFPFQSMKSVRLSLKLAEKLLDDLE